MVVETQTPPEVQSEFESGANKMKVQVPGRDLWYFVYYSFGKDGLLTKPELAQYKPVPTDTESLEEFGNPLMLDSLIQSSGTKEEQLAQLEHFLQALALSYDFTRKYGIQEFLNTYVEIQSFLRIDTTQLPALFRLIEQTVERILIQEELTPIE